MAFYFFIYEIIVHVSGIFLSSMQYDVQIEHETHVSNLWN